MWRWTILPIIFVILSGILPSCCNSTEQKSISSLTTTGIITPTSVPLLATSTSIIQYSTVIGESTATQTVESTPVNPNKILPPIEYLSLQDTFVELYENVSPGVVAIRTLGPMEGSLGSGFVYNNEGYIVTNYHVIENQADLEVTFASGNKYRGRIIGIDQDSDLAVIKVDVSDNELFPLPLGSNSQTKVGQIVIAIGNPFGLERTMTIGILSGKGRTIWSQRTGSAGSVFASGDIIQTDAAINPGNSGGPLLNLNGEVIGVNESILTSGYEKVSSGVAFAISVDTVKRIVPDLIAKGKFDYPYLGIFSLGEITLIAQETLGLPRSTGVYVTDVAPGSPAERAGILAGDLETNLPGVSAGGDLIIAVDGHEVLNFNDLIVYITLNKRPGDKIIVTIIRGSEQLNLEVVLEKRDN